MIIKKWNELPEKLQVPEVKPYYDIINSKKGYLVLKRVLDLICGVILVILLSPFFLILSIAIKFDSKGPVFFRQIRISQYGKKFKIFKFRTMVNDADKIGTQVTVNQDSRITKVGSFIRNCRLDEIPQLLNVIYGDMSFVGTRPEVPKYVDRYTPEMLATLLLPAGITSLASINFKDEAELLSKSSQNIDDSYMSEVLPLKMKYNLQYIQNFNFLEDLTLMFYTILAVIK